MLFPTLSSGELSSNRPWSYCARRSSNVVEQDAHAVTVEAPVLHGHAPWKAHTSQHASHLQEPRDLLKLPRLCACASIGALSRKNVELQRSICRIPCDHVPTRSWPLFKARDLMRGVIESLRQDCAT